MKPAARKPGLFDVNVLTALIDLEHDNPALEHDNPAHEFHAPAHTSIPHNRRDGWATCPARILEAHRFDLAGSGAANLTDLYLLRLAAASQGRLVTFDRRIRWQQVTGCGPDNLEILPSHVSRDTPPA